MSSLRQQLGAAVRFALCQTLNAAGKVEDWVRNIVDPNDPNYSYRSRLIYSNYCDEPPPPPSAPPYEGGQCEFCYTVNIQWTQTQSTNTAFDVPQNVTYNVWGPVESVSVERLFTGSGPGASVPRILAYGDCGAGRLTSPIFTGTPQAPIDATTVITITSISVIPRDGQPDNCGSPPPQLPPPDPNGRQFPIDFNFEYNDGTDFNINGDVFFGLAYFDTDFNLNVPLKFVLDNNVQFNANFNFNTGDINLNFGDRFDYPTPKPPEGDYRPDPDTPPPPPSQEPPPPGFEPPYPPNENPNEEDSDDFEPDEPQQAPKIRRMVGVLVDTVIPPPMPSTINQDDNPIVYAPDIGLVNFAYIIGGTRLYWGEDIRVKNRRQVIWTPSGRYAADVRGTIRQGGEWVLTPIYQEVVESVGV